MHRHQQQPGRLVGFYKDRRGETRPIVKSAVELNRPKFIQHSSSFKAIKPQFHGVSPEAQRRQVENARRQVQRLEGELQNTDREIAKLNDSAQKYKAEAEKAHYEGNEGKLKSMQKSLRLTVFTLQSKMRHRKAVEQQITVTKRQLK